jgi:hypothetical protein
VPRRGHAGGDLVVAYVATTVTDGRSKGRATGVIDAVSLHGILGRRRWVGPLDHAGADSPRAGRDRHSHGD